MLNDPNWDKKVEVELDEVSKHILNAADYIKKHGWCQSVLDTPDGRVCLMGALYASHPDVYKAGKSVLNMVLSNPNNAFTAINSAFKRITYYLKDDPTYWNDRIAKSKEEVINLLETIAYSGSK